LGIKPLPEALALAREQELDLVEVADKATPPVCRIMDYGNYKYQAARRAKESRKNSKNVVVKEMKYRPKIGPGDFDTKTKKVEKFLGEGHKVKLTIMFRGREVYHPELGQKILDRVAERVEHLGRVEIYPRLDGRNMTMVLAPDKKAQAAWLAQQKKDAEDAARSNGGAPSPEDDEILAVVAASHAEAADSDDSDDHDHDHDDEHEDEHEDAAEADRADQADHADHADHAGVDEAPNPSDA
jgi:translation initiation factor IF-3